MLLEVCANSIQSAKNAQLGGAQRIELCQNLNEGGTTPSFAAIEYCTHQLQMHTFVLIRPRGGHFCYHDDEFRVMKQEVIQCKKMDVAGIVIGLLHSNYTIDIDKTRQMVELAFPMQVTFHRAFDICKYPQEALEDIISCGCHRLLTSGNKPTAFEGIDNLQQIVKQANRRIGIIAAAGINSKNVVDIIARTHVNEVHASCKHTISQYGDRFTETDPNEVTAILNQINMDVSTNRGPRAIR